MWKMQGVVKDEAEVASRAGRVEWGVVYFVNLCTDSNHQQLDDASVVHIFKIIFFLLILS